MWKNGSWDRKERGWDWINGRISKSNGGWDGQNQAKRKDYFGRSKESGVQEMYKAIRGGKHCQWRGAKGVHTCFWDNGSIQYWSKWFRKRLIL